MIRESLKTRSAARSRSQPHDVPVAAPALQDPRFDLPLLGVGGGGLAVVEDDRTAVAAGQHQRLESGFMGGDAGFEGAVRLPGVVVLAVGGQWHPRRAQLLQRAARGAA